MKSIIKKIIGVILIIIGLAALFTPLTPGSWLALIGLELLGIRMVFFKKFLNEKQRAAVDRFMKKFGIKSFEERPEEKPGKKEGQ